MKIRFSALAILLLALKLSADQTNAPAPSIIGALDATNFYGREMIVTGKVAQVSFRSSIVFLNLDHPYPNSPFALVIFNSATNQFGNLKSLKGASIAATGKITNYHGKPEMVLEKMNQLQVAGMDSTNSSSAQ
jgi:hypothetical protein